MEVGLLGSLRVSSDPPVEIPPGRPSLLFAYLVEHRERPVSRAELIELLWPAQLPRDPAAALRTVLSRLRSAVHAPVLGAGAVGIPTLPALRTDVDRLY